MTETALSLLLDGGPLILLVTTLLSCLAVPVPTSLLMLSAGAFAASDDLSLATVAPAALAGALIGDQAGFAIGRRGGAALTSRLSARPGPAKLLVDARAFLDRWGGAGVFLSRWLFSPLGPYVNFLAAGLGMSWFSFTLWASLGEAVWVGVYVGLGYAFSDQLSALAGALSSASGALAAGALTIGLGYLLIHADRRRQPHP